MGLRTNPNIAIRCRLNAMDGGTPETLDFCPRHSKTSPSTAKHPGFRAD
ncbi:hypothetical protein [Granulicella aggregans]|nr:hypothetical protein [Granulicella aggregans]